jgi:cell fate regulator YaaT (PSP1 superfamily)
MNDNNDAVDVTNEPDTSPGRFVVGIRFKACGKIYTFEAGDLEVSPGDSVVVDSDIGLSIGRVVTPKQAVEKADAKLKKVVRIASEKDFQKVEKNKSFGEEAKAFCVEKARKLNLPMKIVTTETTLDRKRLTFYFTADGRIDFRELVRDLAAKFKTRIEMRQIGVRDEVKLLGGIGVCGRQACCRMFLTSFAPITIRMAKQQELSINQSKLSGICGRLMCCLGYEFKDAASDAAGNGEQGEELVTVSDEAIEQGLQTVDLENVQAEGSGEEVLLRSTLPEGGQDAGKAERTADDEKRKHGRRGRRRRKRGKQAGERQKGEARPSGSGPESRETVTQGRPAEGKGKGKPFNKRRRFWKKKKKQTGAD